MRRFALPCAGIVCAAMLWPGGVAAADDTLLDSYFEQAMRRRGKAAAAEVADRLLEEHADDALTLDACAWRILTDETLRHRDLNLALRASRRAHAITDGTDRDVLETHARALIATGRRDEGIALHRRAIELSADDPSTRLVLEEILQAYLEPQPADPTDDDRIRDLEAAAEAIVAAGKAVPVATLLANTGVGPATIDLLPRAERPLTAQEIYERVQPAVVVMASLEPDPDTGEDELTLASGFVIHPSGIVVTNFHVIDAPEAPVLVAMTAAGRVFPVTKILAVSPAADIAICRLEGAADLPALPLVADARPGQRLHALSHPDGAFWSLTEGILSRYSSYREDGRTTRMFTTTADFAVGSSGGPLVDDCGNVVGMVSSTLAVYAQEGTLPRRRPPAARDTAPDTDDAAATDAAETDTADTEGEILPVGDFQMGLNMCVPAADILRLTGHRP
jgi:serine protease Do